MRSILLSVVLLGAVVAAGARPAAAQDARDDEARANFEAGRAAMSDGRYEDALDYFERSYELSGRPALLFNVGSVAERLRRDELALESYREYLALEPEAENRPEVESRIAILEEALTAPEGAPSSRVDEGGETPLVKQWWLWTLVGVLVVGGVTAGVVVGTAGDPGAEAPLAGTHGVIVEALHVSF